MARTDTSAVAPAPDAGESGSEGRRASRWSDRTGRWRRGLVIAGLALLTAAVMLLHSKLPNSVGNLGSLIQTFLPWFGLAVPVLLVCALIRRSLSAVAALTVTVMVWVNLFGAALIDKTGEGGALMVVSHNVDAHNQDPRGTARSLIDSDTDILALQEIPEGQGELYDSELNDSYPFHSVQGTVGLWSRFPMGDSEEIDIGMGWPRAMRSTVETPQGVVAVYVAHLPSVRVEFRSGFTAGQRDRAASTLAEAISAEEYERIILLGDLNGTMNDRALAPLTSQMRSTQGATGRGFGFSFPAQFPMTRIDQILVRGVEPVSSWSLPATGSDHLLVAARIDP